MTDLPVSGALDLATQTGVCCGLPFNKPKLETWMLDGDPGVRGVKLMRSMSHWLDRHPTLIKVYIEAPLSAHVSAQMGTQPMTTIYLNGFVFIAMTLLTQRDIGFKLIKRQDVLHHFTGRARWPDSNAGKQACFARATQLKWTPANWDEADAAALWDYGCALDNSGLFMRAAVERRKAY